MGDMLEKIILPLHQRNTIAEECFSPSDKMDKATSTTSLGSRSSTPGTPRSPLSPGSFVREGMLGHTSMSLETSDKHKDNHTFPVLHNLSETFSFLSHLHRPAIFVMCLVTRALSIPGESLKEKLNEVQRSGEPQYLNFITLQKWDLKK